MVGKRVIAWGAYDNGKARVRLLLGALRRREALAAEIRIDAWRGIEDKTVAGPLRMFKAALILLISYPAALLRLLAQPRGSAVLLAYPGIPDIFVVALFARLRGDRIVLDAFLPLHDTIVRDRRMVGDKGWAARLIWAVERIGLRLADVILVDTDQHGEFFASEFGIAPARFVTVLVGAEPLFNEPPQIPFPLDIPPDRPVVLFYGQLIPLHGLATILEAVRLTEGEPFHWVIVGRGQEGPLLAAALKDRENGHVTWIPWVDYTALPALIARATICLGVFGASDKAARVIPNKVFQALAAGKPVITRAGPAVDTLAARYPAAITTVPANDAVALAAAVREAMGGRGAAQALPTQALAKLGPDAGVDQLLNRLDAA